MLVAKVSVADRSFVTLNLVSWEEEEESTISAA